MPGKVWPELKLSEILAEPIRNGFSPPESQAWTGVQMLGLGCLSTDGFSPDQLKNAPDSVSVAHPAILQHGDLLISRANTRTLVGMVGIYRDIGTPCIYPDLMMRVRPSARYSVEFLELVLRSPRTRRRLMAIAQGTSESMVKISGKALRQLPIPDVPPSEQRRIVQVIDSFSEFEREIEASIAKFKALRFGVMEELAELECGRFGEVLKQGPQNGIYKPASSYGLQGTPIVRIDSFSRGRSDLTRGLLRVAVTGGEIARYGLDMGDIIINRVNTPDLVGKSTSVRRLIEPTIFESNMMRCKLHRSVADPVFTEAWLGSPTVKRYFLARAKSAISQASINGDDVRSCPFPKLDVSGQLAFLERLDAVENQRLAEVAELAKLRQLKLGVVDDLLSGRVAVPGVVA
ncbi:restriction endonuclease subunit S domain-containing protein [Streptomyces shenzhenensis]|uniref:hypothetical protein n=1 Tax=Streptomyces shenzhenensis TaxID=943815 RepID=UPI0015F07505|nr:hypothetical protein [Streptomyces shenzhenensis]